MGVAAGKGLGSALGQVKRVIAKLGKAKWDSLIDQQRSPDRKVGMVLNQGPRFAADLKPLMEALR